MKEIYRFSRNTAKWAMAGLLTVGTVSFGQTQGLNYKSTGVQFGNTAYPELGTTSLPGTPIATPNTDDANSAPQEIGFTFNYNGQNFTQFILNTNGFIKLGNSAPTGSYFFEGAQTAYGGPFDSSDPNLIVPFNEDLQSGTSPADYRVITVGVAPNRICIVQWKNVQDKARSAGPGKGNVGPIYTNMTFQVRLFETSNNIDLAYGTFTGGTNTKDEKLAAVGIKGSNGTNGNLITFFKPSSFDWLSAGYQDNIYDDPDTDYAFEVSSSVVPTSGTTYRLTPAKPNDLAVGTIYTLGKLANSISLPHTVSATVTNVGLATQTNVPVTLAVTGANTFTSTKSVGSLAPGATTTVTFDPYPTTLNQGTNSVRVSVRADEVTTNDAATYSQQVTANAVSYIDPSQQNPYSIGLGQANGALAAKFTNSRAISISQVTANFAASPAAATTYQVLIYDANGSGGSPGTLRFTSPVRTRAAAASSETIDITPTTVNGSFFIALRELDNNIGLAYQNESPLRTGAFYFTLDGTSWRDVTSLPGFSTRLSLGAVFTTVTANSPELKRAISVYPNPSAGAVTLDVRGVAAKKALQVEISNSLGQTVYTGTVKSEATNTLDLSTLASGIYNLKVQNGDQYTIQKLTIK